MIASAARGLRKHLCKQQCAVCGLQRSLVSQQQTQSGLTTAQSVVRPLSTHSATTTTPRDSFKATQGKQGDVALGTSPDAQPRTWTWSTNAPKRAGRTDDIEIKLKVPLTIEEITSSLERNGALDIRVVQLAGKSELADAMICCTGKSQRHMQRLSDILSYTLKKRKLHQAPGITGPEGYDCDDWMIVDCWNLIVHVFEASFRKELRLEKYWENMKPYNPADWVGIRDRDHLDSDEDDSDDDDADLLVGEESEELVPFVETEQEGKIRWQKEQAAAEQIANHWAAHIKSAQKARKSNATEERAAHSEIPTAAHTDALAAADSR